MFVILEYLYLTSQSNAQSNIGNKTNPSSNSPVFSVSKYHIMTKVPELKQQRQDRLSDILRILENNKLIVSTVTPNATFYRITEKGAAIYLKWVNYFLEFVREIRFNDEKI